MKHWHHIIPRHQGGTDDPSNLVEVTVEEHAEIHRVLWEKYGNEFDKIAWRCLSGLINCEEARREAAKIAQIERWQKEGEKERQSKKMAGNAYGKTNKNRVYSAHTLEKMAAAKKNRPQRRCSCVICKKEISVSNVIGHYKWKHSTEEERERFVEVFRERFDNESKEARTARIEKTAIKNRGRKRKPYKTKKGGE